MKILCIDTSSKLCSVAVLEDTTLIKKLLSNCNLHLKDIDLLVSDIGPGSFTGIRIGVATCKAFSDSLDIPCIGISALEVLAYNIKNDGLICSSIDCKNDNCYFALYELKNGIYTTIQKPSSKPVLEVLDILKTTYSNKSIKFVGDGIPSKSTNSYLDIKNLGIAGFNKYTANKNNGESILPLYLKKPQAQIQLEEKSIQNELKN